MRFHIQSLTSREMRELRAWVAEEDANRWRIWEALIVRCLVDEDGHRIYQDSEVDAGVFDDWDGSIVEQVGITIDEHVGYMADVWSIKKLENAAKN